LIAMIPISVPLIIVTKKRDVTMMSMNVNTKMHATL
jgi:hypothetical protein